MTATATRTPKQSPEIKSNPWLITRDAATGCWLVPSASSDRTYSVSLSAAAAGVYPDACQCEAAQHGRRCWHVETAELREQLDHTAEACRAYYAGWTLRDLQAEDLRLLTIAAAEGLGPFLLTQYNALGDRIGELTRTVEAA